MPGQASARRTNDALPTRDSRPCGANISIAPDDVNDVGDSHTFTITLNESIAGNETASRRRHDRRRDAHRPERQPSRSDDKHLHESRRDDQAPQSGSVAVELAQALLADPEVMRNLVNDDTPHLFLVATFETAARQVSGRP